MSSTGGETLGTVKVLCPSIKECLGQELGVGVLGAGGEVTGEGTAFCDEQYQSRSCDY